MKAKFVVAIVVAAVVVTASVTWLVASKTAVNYVAPEVPIHELAAAPTTPAVTSPGTVTISGLTFELPAGWVTQEVVDQKNAVSTWQEAKIKVPDPKYNVIIPVDVAKQSDAIVKIVNEENKPIQTLPTGDAIYGEACAPALGCYYVKHGDTLYLVSFNEPESDQPAPANLEGPWFPDTTVTQAEILNFVATVK
ncbi:MAG: hypothetical protein PHT12_03215 [Patescibacteria group bacterium]|nr:hypothetical protein [Patescibacteria group bacterium]